MTAAVALLGALAIAPAATASVYGDYASGGSLQSCSYTPEELRNALANVPPDIQQYDPGFVDALNAALANSASGACDGGGGGAAQGGGTGQPGAKSHLAKDGSPKPTDASPGPAKLASAGGAADLSGDSGFPIALAVLAGLFGLMLLAATVFALTRTDAASANGTLARPVRAVGAARRAASDYFWGLRDRFRR